MDNRTRILSPPAARILDANPRAERFLKRCIRPEILNRLHRADEETARRAIRLVRSRVFLWCVESEANGGSPWETTSAFNRLADSALRLADAVAWRSVCNDSGVRGDFPSSRTIIALGKLGSLELNPSSDIDLLFINGSDAGSAGEKSAHQLFERWVHRVRSILADRDENGFGFRVDLDLRPEGRAGAVVNSLDAIERYYENFGKNWERIALLRARPVVDVGDVGQVFMQRIESFCYPRTPDASVRQSISRLRGRISATASSSGFDLKRSSGGIRDLEFIVQTFQHFHGRKMKTLRGKTIVALLRALEQAGLLNVQSARDLEDAYTFLRRVEHALQLSTDQQTQHLPDDGQLFDRVLSFLRGAFPQLTSVTFAEKLRNVAESVCRLADETFGVTPPLLGEAELALDVIADDEVRKAALQRLGFEHVDSVLEALRSLSKFRGSPFSPRQRVANAAAEKGAQELLIQMGKTENPDMTIERLTRIMPTLVQPSAWRRLLDGETVSRRMLRILSISGFLSRVATRDAEKLIDALVRPMGGPQRVSTLRHRLRPNGDAHADERFAHTLRQRLRHLRLRLGIYFLDGEISHRRLSFSLSQFADAAIQEALEHAKAYADRKVPGVHGAELAVMGLGALGGKELGLNSDLDLLFVYRARDANALGVGEWAVRASRRAIWLLSTPLETGIAFDVDTRLRPSGNQGSLCVTLSAFREYHSGTSQLWERQSLLRMRGVAGDAGLQSATITSARAIDRGGDDEAIGMQLIDMRARMRQEHASGSGFDPKHSDGGLLDIDFAVQGLQLVHGGTSPGVINASTYRSLSRLKRAGLIEPEVAIKLRDAYALFSSVRIGMALVDETQSSALQHDDERLPVIARMLKPTYGVQNGAELRDMLLDVATMVREESFRLLVRL